MSDSQAQHEAKLPRSALAGPYGHPFHPIAVTIPIGAWSASVVFDAIALMSADAEPFAVGARVLIIIGLIGAAFAATFGLLDLSRLARRTPARRTAVVHMIANATVFVLFIVGLFLRADDPRSVGIDAFIVSIVAVGGLGISGWLGGKLAYRWGVRVADEQAQRNGFIPQ